MLRSAMLFVCYLHLLSTKEAKALTVSVLFLSLFISKSSPICFCSIGSNSYLQISSNLQALYPSFTDMIDAYLQVIIHYWWSSFDYLILDFASLAGSAVCLFGILFALWRALSMFALKHLSVCWLFFSLMASIHLCLNCAIFNFEAKSHRRSPTPDESWNRK